MSLNVKALSVHSFNTMATTNSYSIPTQLSTKEQPSTVSFGVDPLSFGVIYGVVIPSAFVLGVTAIAAEFFAKRGILFGVGRWFGKGKALNHQTVKDFLPITPFVKKAEEYLRKAANG